MLIESLNVITKSTPASYDTAAKTAIGLAFKSC